VGLLSSTGPAPPIIYQEPSLDEIMMTDEEWNGLLTSVDSPALFQPPATIHQNCLNQQAVKKGNKMVILNNCNITNFNF
jgi:hypothetical protein